MDTQTSNKRKKAKVNVITNEHGVEFKLVRANHLRNLVGLYSKEIIKRYTENFSDRFVTDLSPRGGATVATYVNTANGKLYTGISICSDEDVFCKTTGLVYAGRRAMDACKNNLHLGIPKMLIDQLLGNKRAKSNEEYFSLDAMQLLVVAIKQNRECIPFIK